jgi:hypothetical protein
MTHLRLAAHELRIDPFERPEVPDVDLPVDPPDHRTLELDRDHAAAPLDREGAVAGRVAAERNGNGEQRRRERHKEHLPAHGRQYRRSR